MHQLHELYYLLPQLSPRGRPTRTKSPLFADQFFHFIGAMADAHTLDNGHIVPTAVKLREEEFPFSNRNSSDSTQGTSLKPSATDLAPKHDSVQTESNESPRPSLPQLSRLETDISSPSQPQLPQKSATEQPQNRARASWFGKKQATTSGRQPHLGRQPTLTFDPYSSDSSSLSDEDELPTSASVHGEAKEARSKEHQERKHRKTHSNPFNPFSKFKLANEHFHTKGKVSKIDGRLKLSIHETVNSGYFAKTLGAGLKKHFRGGDDGVKSPLSGSGVEPEKITPEEDEMEHDPSRRMRLNICVIVIGSRGDIQPFLKIGKILKEGYGHRVRIATHPAFKKFVEEDSGLEFFSVGGDPSELMAFMVKNPGLIPSIDTVKAGEVGKRRASMYEMFLGMWRACIDSTDDENDKANMKMMGDKQPFVADAIIANPPSFAPPHIAERLGVPLHMMFTFPYTPTVQFPHPLANIKTSNVDAHYTNFMSYPLVEVMTWQGLGDLINRFRFKTLCLEEVSTLWAPGQLYRLKVPYTYMWSPSLVPKPKDWGPEIDIAGFAFLELASSFKPPESLSKFLDDGPPPVYIGFGSIVVDDPDKFTKLIFEAVEMAGVRALVSKGWGGLGDQNNTPDNIYMLENTPHDWLFPRVCAVVHHGGAGTTAIGLKCGRPTMIVPFFGDQPFWGAMVAKAKAGAHEYIPYKKLTAERLAEGIKQCLTDEAKENVQKIADSIAKEGDGATNAVRSFHRSLPLRGNHNMRCQILENRVATWRLKNTNLRLCPLAAELLVEWKKVKWNELRLLRHCEWNDFGGPGEPFTGGWGAILGTVSDVATGVGLVPVNMVKSVKKREEYYEKKRRVKRRQKHAKKTLAQVKSSTPDASANSSKPADNIHESTEKKNRPASPQRQETTLSKLSEPEQYLAEELAQEAGHGFRKTGAAIVKAPMEFSVAVTQGFHNAPRLYGDETVRRPPRITGFHSGLRAGRDEFVYGIHDGFTGLWTHPYHGAKEGGIMGFLHGVGMGIGGVVLKDIAAFLGPGAYVMKGLHEEVLKKYQPTNSLRRARIIQGQKELTELGPRMPRRKSGAENRDSEYGGARRQEVEIEVSRKWDKIQAQILTERRKNKAGLRASLLGRKQKNLGKAVLRKGWRANIPPSDSKPKKSSSTPIGQAEKAEDAFKWRDRGNTTPDSAIGMGWKDKTKRKHRIETVPKAVKEEAMKDGVGKNEVPSVFGASLQGNRVPVGGQIGKENKDVREDEAVERKRATSDTTDWATVKKGAEEDVR
ncbi:glycosyltransferase family 1 protein [Zopfia rhizophila CBS 207.26]|uniref:Glycosyltransferase family 1 protein n=1 Tax=Zopfia rhizophila CBS 207.26 TaxID=1314779 RepID=A0A6A6DYH3_9PEZI|nr:glycosyltransferase family 1 protein [Zopfia rhizophila CBS 207.26]